MESITVANVKPGQSFTLTFGNKEPVFTKVGEPNLFNVEEWFPEEREIYILETEIAEDEPLHYSLKPFASLDEALKIDKGVFGAKKQVFDFLGHTVDSIESEDLEEEEDDEEENDEDESGDETDA